MIFIDVSEILSNSIAFLVIFLCSYQQRDKMQCFLKTLPATEHNYVKTGPTNLFEMENGSNHSFLSQKSKKKVV